MLWLIVCVCVCVCVRACVHTVLTVFDILKVKLMYYSADFNIMFIVLLCSVCAKCTLYLALKMLILMLLNLLPASNIDTELIR
jgi:hypothetical protein